MGLDAALIDGSVLAWGAVASGIVGASVLDRLFDSGESDDDAVFDDAGGLDGGSGDDSFEAFDEMDATPVHWRVESTTSKRRSRRSRRPSRRSARRTRRSPPR
jgi:hypothetical protein